MIYLNDENYTITVTIPRKGRRKNYLFDAQDALHSLLGDLTNVNLNKDRESMVLYVFSDILKGITKAIRRRANEKEDEENFIIEIKGTIDQVPLLSQCLLTLSKYAIKEQNDNGLMVDEIPIILDLASNFIVDINTMCNMWNIIKNSHKEADFLPPAMNKIAA